MSPLVNIVNDVKLSTERRSLALLGTVRRPPDTYL